MISLLQKYLQNEYNECYYGKNGRNQGGETTSTLSPDQRFTIVVN